MKISVKKMALAMALTAMPMMGFAGNKGPEWLSKAVAYQIYPSSYQDSDGDGIGDIPGITSRLDYIKGLGVNVIWLNPVFVSGWFDGGYDIIDFYKAKLKNSKKFQLKMLHFFINTGIKDTAYYWNELSKCMNVYCELKAICPELDSLNIGGGFPIKNSLNFEYDYEYLTEEIVAQIKHICEMNGIEEPNIFTEFGSFTVGESGATLFSIINQKQQNDRECWYMIDSSFMTTLPDIWGINQRYILLAVNNWDREYQRVFLGGLTCDSEDYYNGESHSNAIFLPKLGGGPQYIGFFHTGAYQESVGGYGGIQHCLIPAPKHIIIDRDKGDNEYYTRLFAKEQSYRSMMRILGY